MSNTYRVCLQIVVMVAAIVATQIACEPRDISYDPDASPSAANDDETSSVSDEADSEEKEPSSRRTDESDQENESSSSESEDETSDEAGEDSPDKDVASGGGYELGPLRTDPETGVPYASVFGFPIDGFTRTDFNFPFGGKNDAFGGMRHLGVDTYVSLTPYNTEVVAPADGIVRITTDFVDSKGTRGFGAYGSDSSSNPDYYGCLVVLEHVLPSGEFVTTLIGHVRCESVDAYDSGARTGNPPRNTIVRKGQYIGHVRHYWHGSDHSTDWHHSHFGVRRGRFSAPVYDRTAELVAYVQGYDYPSAFTRNGDGTYAHDTWLDPIDFVEAHDDPLLYATGNVLHHPSGTMLLDRQNQYWMVVSDTEIARLKPDVGFSDRYAYQRAVLVSDEELSCYVQTDPIVSYGKTYLYRRPGSTAVVIAFENTGARYDFPRWEALLSWNYQQEDIHESTVSALWYESMYNPEGFLTLRPGTLAKGDAESEVAIITWEQTRLAIQSGELFEALGYQWDDVVVIPQSVLDVVAGPREDRVFDRGDIVSCPALPACGDGSTCGGGLEPTPADSDATTDDEVDSSSVEDSNPVSADESDTTGNESTNPVATETDSSPAAETLYLSYESPVCGSVSIQGYWNNPDGSARAWALISECVDVDPSDCSFACNLPVPINATDFTWQIYLSDGLTWGNQDCYDGGCGAPFGELTLSMNGASVPYTFIPNSAGAPYYNGYLATVPGDLGSIVSVATDPVSSSTDESDPSSSEPESPPVVDPEPSTENPVSDPVAPVSSATDALLLSYTSPVSGSVSIQAYWVEPGGALRDWGVIASCADGDPADNRFTCELPIPSGSTNFTWQIYLPDGLTWGNLDCYDGGCGAPFGELAIAKNGVSIPYEFIPNSAGPPYYNGFLSPVP